MGKNLVSLAEFDGHDCKGTEESGCSTCVFFTRSRAKFKSLMSRMDLVRRNSRHIDYQLIHEIMQPIQEEKQNAKY